MNKFFKKSLNAKLHSICQLKKQSAVFSEGELNQYFFFLSPLSETGF